MFCEGDLGSQLPDIAFGEGAIVFLGGDARHAIAQRGVVHQGREVHAGVLGIPHTGEAADHENLGKGFAAVDEVGDALRRVEFRQVHLIQLQRLHKLHFEVIQAVVFRCNHFQLHVPVGGVSAVEQAFPETPFALAAYAYDAAEGAIHVTIGAYPGITLLENIQTGQTQLPRGCNQLRVGDFAISDKDEGEAHEVRYSARMPLHSQRKYVFLLSVILKT